MPPHLGKYSPASKEVFLRIRESLEQQVRGRLCGTIGRHVPGKARKCAILSWLIIKEDEKQAIMAENALWKGLCRKRSTKS